MGGFFCPRVAFSRKNTILSLMSSQTVPLGSSNVRLGVRIEILSTVWMVIEAAGSLLGGFLAASIALEAFGIDSVVEIAGSVVLLWRLSVEARGGQQDQVRKAERVASWIVGVGLLLLAVYIAASSVLSLVFGSHAQTSILGIVVTAISSVFMPWLATAKKRIGKAIGSKALESDGFCSMVCAYMSWIVLGGLFLNALLGWWWIDSLAALSLIYFVVKEGLEAIESARSEEATCSCCKS